MVIDIVRREHLSAALLNGMHQLRAQIFKDKKQWDVVVSDRWEVDAFDDLNPYYLLISTPSAGEVIGCWRILETVGPYMLKDTFPDLLHGAPAPQDSRTPLNSAGLSFALNILAIRPSRRSRCRQSGK